MATVVRLHVQSDLLDLWSWHQSAAGHSPRTVSQRVAFVVSLATNSGRCDPVDLHAADLIRYLSRDLSAWTKRTYFMHGRAWFRWLHQEGYRDADETARMPVPKAPKVVPKPFATAVLTAAIQTAGPRTMAYLTLAAFEGLRASEVAAVAGEDFGDGGLHVHGKGGVERVVPVHPRVAALAKSYPAKGYWFPGADHGHVAAHTVSGTVKRHLTQQHIAGSIHRGRHWFGTATLRSANGNIRVVQELMGHASPSTTAGYTQVDDDERTAAVMALPDFLSGAA